MKTLTRAIVTVAAAVLVLGALFSAKAATPDTAGVKTYTMEANYPQYRSLRELATRSPIIVHVTAVDVQAARRVIPDGIPMDQLPAHKAEAIGWVETPVAFTVRKTLRGPAELTKSTIVVRHMGGQLGDARYLMEGEPVSTKGRSYLLFLEQAPDGTYTIVGGPAGRYQVKNQKLQALSAEVITSGAPKQIHGQDVTPFLKNFKTLVRNSRPEPEAPAQAAPAQAPAEQPRLENKPQGLPAGNN